MKSKICSGCKAEKPLSCFHKKKSMPDGYQYRCIECRRGDAAEYRRTHSKEINLRAVEWRKSSPAWKRWWSRYYAKNKKRLNQKSRVDGKRRYAAVRGKPV